MRRLFFTLLLIILVLSAAVPPRQTVKADSTVTAYDLIAMVNSIRTGSYGLPALVENSILNAEAQWTAEEMAAIGAKNHLAFLGYSDASTRAADWGFGSGKVVFVTENWYGGYYADIGDIQSGWADTEHMYPMTKSQYVYVGAGVATASDGFTYYVLQAGNIAGETSASYSSSDSYTYPTNDTTSNSSEYISPVYTNTPSADGMVYHIVQANQFLFDIALAYGVTTDYLVELNGLASADDIYEGETLKIGYAPTNTPTATATNTPEYPTRTPTDPGTPTPYLTATPTPMPSLLDQLPDFDRGTFGFLLVIVSGIGLLLVIFFNFAKPIKRSVIEPKPEPEAPPEKKPVKKPVKKAPAKPAGEPIDVPIKTSKKTTRKM